jgi:hypothetical protein
MVEPPGAECTRAKEKLLDQALTEAPDAAAPAELEAHLARCLPCERYAAGLRSAPALLGGQHLFGADLRRRTVAAIEARAEAKQRRLAWLLAPAAALVIFLSFALPAWLLSIPLSGIVGSDALALALGLVIVHALGAIPAGLCTVLVLRHRLQQNRLEEVFHE